MSSRSHEEGAEGEARSALSLHAALLNQRFRPAPTGDSPASGPASPYGGPSGRPGRQATQARRVWFIEHGQLRAALDLLHH